MLERQGRQYFAVEEELLPFIEGSIIDFEEAVHKTGFVVKQNPNVELTCSCKRSFSPKAAVFSKISKPEGPLE